MIWSFASARRLCLFPLLATACVSQAPEQVSSSAPSAPQGSSELFRTSPRPADEDRLLRWRSLARPDRPLLLARAADGTLRATAGLQLPLPGETPEARLERFIAEAGGLLAFDPGSSYRLERDVTDRFGHRHLRFTQHRAGLPVFGARLELHFRGALLTSFNSSLVRLDGLRLQGELTAADAVAELKALGLLGDAAGARELIVSTGHGKGERAWRLIAHPVAGSAVSGLEELLVSAVDGRLLYRSPLQLDASDPVACQSSSQRDCMVHTTGTGVDGREYALELFRGDGFPLPVLYDGYGHPYPTATYPDLFSDSSPDDTFFVDVSDPENLASLYVVHSDGAITNGEEIFFYDEEDYYTHGPGPTFDSPEYAPSVSAMASIRYALEYYRDWHGREGMSDDAASPVSIVARVGLRGLNAAWVSEMNYMIFGSWMGTSLAIGHDVTGHELTHGVNFFSSRLGGTYESGALNEALADTFGVMIEAERDGKLDWWIGEDIPALIPLRNLAHPEWYSKPGHMSEYLVTDGDYGGVHTNMSIPSKAFQLAVDGTPSGEPWHGYEVTAPHSDRLTAARMVVRPLYAALAYRLTPTSTFTDYAVSALAGVDEVELSSDEADRVYASLRDAFLATGILTMGDGTPNAILTGSVVEQGSSRAIAGATVTLTYGTTSLHTTTDAHGVYWFKHAVGKPVSASVTASAYGYYSSSKGVTLAPLNEAKRDQLQVDLSMGSRPAAMLRYTPPTATVKVKTGATASFNLQLSNGGVSDSQLVYAIRPTVEYRWAEVPFEWEDVLEDGAIISVTGDQGHSPEMPLYLSFPFYFGTYDSFYVSTDGYLTLTEDATLYYRDYPIPSDMAPAHLIAPYWSDLDFGRTERAFFYHDPSRQISYLQFQEVPDYMGDYFYTFQTVFYPDGRIRFYYLYVPATSASYARVGIQDGQGEEGLEVAFNKPDAETGIPYSRSGIELAPSIPPFAETVKVGQGSGMLTGGQNVTVPVTVSAQGLAKGTYTFKMRLETNDAANPVRKDTVTVVVE